MTTALSGRGCVPWPGLYSGYEQMTFSNPASVMRPDRAVPRLEHVGDEHSERAQDRKHYSK